LKIQSSFNEAIEEQFKIDLDKTNFDGVEIITDGVETQ